MWIDSVPGPEIRIEGEGGIRFGSNIYVMGVSKSAWERISSFDQEAILSISQEEWAIYTGSIWEKRDQEFLSAALEEGGSHVMLNSSETLDALEKTHKISDEHARNYECLQDLSPIYVSERSSDLYCFDPDELKNAFMENDK